MTLLTIFTAPKPFTNPHIATIQWNALQSWVHLPEVEVFVIGQEEGLAAAANELGLKHLPNVARNPQGTPLVSSIFALARAASASPFLAYVNADMLLLPDFVGAARQVAAQVGTERNFLIVGQRWDLEARERLDFSSGWELHLRTDTQARGRLHPAGGSDYFVFPQACFADMPKLAIGRAGWDNWMIFHARQQGWPVVDVTPALMAIHQDHDYSHLPGGQPHYRLPETFENIRLAGGRRVLFTLLDADYRLEGGEEESVESAEGVGSGKKQERYQPLLSKIPLQGKRFWRSVETFPLVRLHSAPLAEVFFAFFHPREAWGEWRGRFAYLLGKVNTKVSAVLHRKENKGG